MSPIYERCAYLYGMDSIIEEVKRFAENAHGEQLRKYTKEPYIVHPVRVLETCRKYTDNVSILSAALLHDVLEDTPVTPDEMEAFLLGKMPIMQAQHTLKLVIDLTDVYVKASYPDMNRKQRKMQEADRLCAISPDAQTVKYADILDNAADFAVHDKDFAIVFASESLRLLKRMNTGNPLLYGEVLTALQHLKTV